MDTAQLKEIIGLIEGLSGDTKEILILYFVLSFIPLILKAILTASVLLFGLHKLFLVLNTLVSGAGTKLRQSAGVRETWSALELKIACDILNEQFQERYDNHTRRR